MLDGIFEYMFGGEQRVFLEGWLSVAAKSLGNGEFRVGQALVIAGPGNGGKSVLQYLVTYLLGGRTGSPYHYMCRWGIQTAGSFSDMEHLKIEDRIVSTPITKRLEFGLRVSRRSYKHR